MSEGKIDPAYMMSLEQGRFTAEEVAAMIPASVSRVRFVARREGYRFRKEAHGASRKLIRRDGSGHPLPVWFVEIDGSGQRQTVAVRSDADPTAPYDIPTPRTVGADETTVRWWGYAADRLDAIAQAADHWMVTP